jgi:predicted RND superfamily exporter protein
MSIVMNMGTNIVFKDVSFITSSVSPILQLGCSLDYAVFLLHSFGRHRSEHEKPETAMFYAIKESFAAVAASASTTLFGFIALVFMSFLIGVDLGINLAKGIIFSFLSCTIFLPALALSAVKLIDRTSHKQFLPSFDKFCKVLLRLSVPVTLIVVIVIVPCFLGQQRSNFLYGSEGVAASNRTGSDSAKINDAFGRQSQTVILIPKGDVAREAALSADLQNLEHITGVMSYAKTVGTQIPAQYLTQSVVEQFYSDNYARIIIYTDTNAEGAVAFAAVENLEACV